MMAENQAQIDQPRHLTPEEVASLLDEPLAPKSKLTDDDRDRLLFTLGGLSFMLIKATLGPLNLIDQGKIKAMHVSFVEMAGRSGL